MPYADPEERRAYDRAYYIANGERIRARIQAHYEANGERIRARIQAHYDRTFTGSTEARGRRLEASWRRTRRERAQRIAAHDEGYA